MIVPGLKRGSLFIAPIVSLIDPRHAGPSQAYVIQHSLGNFEPDTQTLEVRRQGASEIMQTPRGQGEPAFCCYCAVHLQFAFVIASE